MIDVYSTVALVPPFNIDKMYELVQTGITQGGFTIPPVEMTTIYLGDESIYVLVPDEYTQQQIDSIVTILNAVVVDPTRNDLTDDQQEAADLANKLANAIADIGVITDVPGGLKDQINATTTGLKDQLLTLTAFNALSAADRDRLLRSVLLDTLKLIVDHLNVTTHGARADKFELRYIQQQDE